MGPLYRATRFQDTIHKNSSFVVCSIQNESIFLTVTPRGNRNPSQETSSGKGTGSGNSMFLFPDIPCTKKERKVTPDYISFPVPRRLADKRSYSQSVDHSDKILHSNNAKSRFSSKSKEIGITTLSEFHFHRHGISDTAKFSQGPTGSSRDPNTDNQINSVMQTSIGTNFPFSFGQTQCSSGFCSPRQTSLMSPANVSSVWDLIFFLSIIRSWSPIWFDLTMVDENQSLRNRNFCPPSRSQYIPLYGCHSFWMGSPSRANETILSWSLDWRPIPAPYQHVRNDGHTISITFISSPEQKLRMSYCHHPMSVVVRRPSFVVNN